MKRLAPLLGLLWFFCSAPFAQELSEEALQRWFESDDMASPYEEKGGDASLQFIHPPPAEAIPHSHTRLRFDAQSRDTGWVMVEQCHQGLDAVPDAEVVYRFSEMRSLQVTQLEGIEKAWVAGQSVQLKNVSNDARLCVALQARLLHRTDGGHYRMRYGPFQRRFLDSYFPMHVTLNLEYGSAALRLDSITPTAEEGLTITARPQGLEVDAWFRGRLELEFRFTPLAQGRE